ncbi:MAG TPA: CehA/McbA family metallohydrolase [Thermoplasmata archaeon]|nr:CehA/McbA family metallohydrolase [Thermoplasmata archaeon]
MTDVLRVDLHVHSAHSPDSRLTLDEIAARLPYVGLKGFAITDHNSVTAHRELSGLRDRFPGLLVVPGVEVSTREGHLLVYGISELPPARRPIDETLEWAKSHGGISVLAHPLRLVHGVGRKIATAAPVTALETVNGHTSAVGNAKAELTAAQRHVGTTGGSDVHELSDLGRAYTEFSPDISSVEGLLEAIRGGHTSGKGSSLRWRGRLRWSLRTSALRVARGLRPI